MSHLLRKPQQGAVAVIVALWMGVALSCLMVLDIGNLFWQQRELQKIADLAALAGASGKIESDCQAASSAAAQSNAVINGLKDVDSNLLAQPGSWNPAGADASEFFQANLAPINACHVKVSHTVPYFFLFDAKIGGGRTLSAQATALQNSAVVKIGVRSTLASLDTDMSPLLNPLIGGLLGGQLNLDAVGWKALAGLDLNLLKYFKALELESGITLGGYEELLKTDLELGVVLDAMVTALEQEGSSAEVDLVALRSIQALAKVSGLRLQLAQLLGIQSGTPVSALDAKINVLELVQAFVQVANSNNAAGASVKIPIPGLVGIDIALKLIEPPQLFAMGDPNKVVAPFNPLGGDRIYIRTAQLRLLVSVDMKQSMGAFSSVLIDTVDGVVNGLLKVLSPVLNLANLLTGGVKLFNPTIEYLVPELMLKSMRLDIGVDVGGGEAYVTGYQCQGETKTVTTQVKSSLAQVRVGQWGNSSAEAQSNAFANTLAPAVEPVRLLRLDCSGCDGVGKTTPQYFGGLGVRLNSRVGGADGANGEESVERQLVAGRLDEPFQWEESVHTQNILDGLGNSVDSLNPLVTLPADSRASPAGIQGILNALDTVLSSLLGVVSDLLSKILAPILDPLLNALLKLLGIQLGTVDVAAQLRCGGGAELVY